MKILFFIFSFFITTLNASDIAEPRAEGWWKTHPCFEMLADEIALKSNISFCFRNGTSLRATATDPRSDDPQHAKNGSTWRCRNGQETI